MAPRKRKRRLRTVGAARRPLAPLHRPLRIEPLEDRRLLAAVVVGNDLDLVNGDTSAIASLIANDGGDGISLREALAAANNTTGSDSITFDASLARSTISLTEGELQITSSITISGLGADQLTISGGGQTRVFSEVGSGQRIITIADVTIADGLAPSSTGGGAFFSNGAEVNFHRVLMTNNNSQGNNGSTIVSAFGMLEITDSAIVNNLNVGVGAIRLQDNTTVITNTTISGNGTRGISVFNSNSNADSLSLTNVTIANNANEGIEAVAFASTTLLEYQNTIFANNGGQGSIDARGNDAGLPGLSIVSLGHNLLNDTPAGVAAHDAAQGDLRNTDPLLAPLANNGGTSPTHALLPGSPALDAGDPNFDPDDPDGDPMTDDAMSFDQRGTPYQRVADGDVVETIVIDIGAYEAQGIPEALPGDYNRNGVADAADYTVWRDALGNTGLAPLTGADGDGDGMVTRTDYDVWKSHFGVTLQPGAGSTSLSAALAEPVAPSVVNQATAQPPAMPQNTAETVAIVGVPAGDVVVGGVASREAATTAMRRTALSPRVVDLLLAIRTIARDGQANVGERSFAVGDEENASEEVASPAALDLVHAALDQEL